MVTTNDVYIYDLKLEREVCVPAVFVFTYIQFTDLCMCIVLSSSLF